MIWRCRDGSSALAKPTSNHGDRKTPAQTKIDSDGLWASSTLSQQKAEPRGPPATVSPPARQLQQLF